MTAHRPAAINTYFRTFKRTSVVFAVAIVAMTAIAFLVTWRVQAHKANAEANSKTAHAQSPASPSAPLAAFTPGNLVIYRVGSGVGSEINTGNPVFLDEYTTGGALVQSIALPTTASGAQKQLIASGTATSEGLLTRSADARYLLLTGYASDLGGVVNLTGTTSASVPRTIGRVDSSASIDTSTALTDAATGASPRSATSTDGSNLWVDGGAGGIRFATFGGTTSTQISTTVTNLRQANIFSSQLYVSSSSTTFHLSTVGTGTPTTTGQTITNLPGFPITGSQYGFFFADLDAGIVGVDTVFVADDTPGTINKYSLVAGNWTANGTVAATAIRGLTGKVSGTTVTLYGTTGASSAGGGGTVYTVTDATGYNATITGSLATIATAAANTAFRGVAFAPEVITVNPAFLFTGTYNASYGFPISASGGVAPYTFSVTSGSVPTGLTLNSDGTWSGTATAIGDFPFTVTVTDATGAIATKAYTLTINPVLNVEADVTVIEGNSGPANATFNVTLTPASAQTVTVHYSTQDGSATTANNDYAPLPDTLLTFNPGVTSIPITVQVIGDTAVEPDEQFFFNISTPTNANISFNQRSGFITNDDTVLNVTTDPNVIEGNAGTTPATFTVTLTPAVPQTVTVHYSTQDNTATVANSDYQAIADTLLTFTPGQTTKNIDVLINGDTTIEPNEQFFFNINNPLGANISDNQGIGTITNDDANYTVTTTGNAIVVTDNSGNNDPLGMTEPVSGQVSFNVPGRTFSVDGGAAISGNSGSIPLAGVTSITVNENAGNDGFFVGTFVGQLPSLTVNGGTGNDNVQFSGAVTFAPNANLDIDMQNDDPTPGNDRIDIISGGQLHLSGTGTATIKVSQAMTMVGAGTTLLEVQNGNLTIEINQQATPTTGTNAGLFLNGGTFRTTGTGNINVLGKGQSQAGNGTHTGLAIVGGATISSTSAAVGAGTITLNGTGGQGTSFNMGVDLENPGTVVSSVTGDISITGHGGAGSAIRNYGVEIQTGAAVQSTGAAKITINGTAGSGTSSLYGARLEGDDTKVTSSGGDISITGQGGTGTSANTGVGMLFGALVSATNGAKITLDGTGGTGTGSSMFGVGISLAGSQPIPVPTKVTSDSGDITITGHGGNSPSGANIGFNLDSGAQLLATGSANITINGTGGSTGASDNYGVGFEGGATDGTTVSSVNGNLNITGIATAPTGTDQDGVRFEDSGGTNLFLLKTTGVGSLIVNGTAGDNDTTSSGINFVSYTTVTLTGASNTFIADTMDIVNLNVNISAGANPITFRQKTNAKPIDLGGADSATQLGLTDAELDLFTAGTLNFGDTNSGPITISGAIIRNSPTNLNLFSGANIDFTTGSLTSDGGSVNLNPGTNAFPATSGNDVNLVPPPPPSPNGAIPNSPNGSAVVLKIASGKALKIVINGTTADTGYTQLNVLGAIDISGVTLSLSGSHTPIAGQTFTIIDNDGSDPVNGTFASLSEGGTIPNFLGSPLAAKISYVGGTGNDVVLTVVVPTAAPATISGVVTSEDGAPLGGVTVNLNGAGSRRTITDGSGQYHFDNVATDSFYTVTPGLANFSFSPSSRSFSLVGNKADAMFTGRAGTEPTDNPLNGGDYFVRQQYLDFLNREPDMEGWLYWTEQIASCGTDVRCIRQRRLDVSAAFFMSEEFQRSGSYIFRLYRAGLGRALTYAEFRDDHPHVVGGADLETQRTAFADSFVARQEFVTKYSQYTVGETFVDELLRGINVDAGLDLNSQREALLAAYNTGADLQASRSAVLQAIADNTDYVSATYNRAFVQMEYFGYLHRDFDQTGYEFWLTVLQSLDRRDAGTYRGMVCSFLTSVEYQQRFSPIVTHSNAECGQ